jgi:nucleotide-binding universal stress UspA family protein
VFKKIIVGVDFSEKTQKALGVALNLAKAVQGEVVMVHVVPSVAESASSTAGAPSGEVTTTIEQRLREDAAKLTSETGAKVDYGVVEGKAAEELVNYIERWGGHVLVVGTEGRTGLGRIILGSVAEQLIQTSPIPVMVVGPNAL